MPDPLRDAVLRPRRSPVSARLRVATLDVRFIAWAVAWSAVALVAFGLVSAIIPNPIFGREIAPEPFAIAVWIASAPLMGIVAATYTVPAPIPAVQELAVGASSPRGDGTAFGTLASLGAFLAIGCPVCNKVALLLLGTSGAMTIWAPIQPIVGAVSLALLAATVVWRVRLRMRGSTCAVPG